ncbi:MAG TPA: GHKL domain-containing protein [Candidatus Erysipelatoclostridium merdavium]|uniref:GHKL domain-containing protein n=1 Tax=Candidatus Erysipelatoclostridium merdavium TaxID=2838566 RepID=A0A9D1XNG2_9FIRM|nr:GHKL domain-containing protein [Candidatus Erysipelatoclostridium merdavium]
MINFLIEYIYSLMYVIGLTFIISLVIPNVRKQNTVKLMISAIIYAIVVNIVTYSTADFASWFIIGNLICMATDFIYCGFITNQYKLSNLLVTILYYNIFSISSSVLVSTTMLYILSDYLNVLMGSGRCLVIAMINIFSIFISYNILKNKEYIFDGLPTINILFYTVINVIELLIVLLLNTILSTSNDINITISIILMALLLVLVDYFILSSSENFIEKGKLELLENSYSITKQYLEDLRHEQLELNKFKHDFSNHLNVLNGLVNNDSLEAKKYLTKLNENLKEIKQVVFSGNSVVDSIINFKINLNPDINFETNLMVKKEINIPENKLSSLLFNLIDNAIAAARDTNDKTVTIKIISKNDMLLIEISNSANKEPSFITTKGKGHGNGMMIIKEIVSSLGGMINYKYNQNLVSFRIIISE